MSLPKGVIDQLLAELNRVQRHRHDSREGCLGINTDMQVVSRLRVLPPFKVYSRAMVKNLNANLLQGKTVEEILAAGGFGVSSLGELGDPNVLLGAVKLKEGTDIIITRDDLNNALEIASSAGGMVQHGNEWHDPDFSVIGHGNEAHIPDFLPKDGSEAMAGNLDFAQYQAVKFVLENLASPPGSPVAGRSYFNTAEKKAYYYDGTEWKEFCPGPTGAPGNQFDETLAESLETTTDVMDESMTCPFEYQVT